MDYHKWNSWTEKDHLPLPFMDQMLDRLDKKKGGNVFFMIIWVTIKSPFPQTIKIRPLLLVHM